MADQSTVHCAPVGSPSDLQSDHGQGSQGNIDGGLYIAPPLRDWVERVTGAIVVFGQSRRRDPADVDGGRFNAILDDWARGEGLSDVEGRSEAAMRIRDWVSAGDVDHELDLSGLGLSSLSNVLPSTLRRLDVSGNRLETLEDLPSSLVLLRAYNNSITKLSGRPLHASLETLDLSDNRIEHIPFELLAQMGRSCIVSLDGNPLSRQTLAEMTDAIVEDDYNGPIVTMSYPSTDRRRRVAVDADAVLLDDACGNVPAWSDVAAFGDGHFARLLDDRVVAERIRVWVADGDAFQELDLSGLGLSSLPALPPTLRRLNARDNQLVTLPATLPDSLRVIDVSSNQLTSLPEHLPAELQTLIATFNNLSDLPKALPNSLVRLDVAANEITTLPERLPASLVILKAANNLITKVPDNLPAPLEMLNLSGNRIESFPPGLLLQLGRNCVVLLDDNPLSRQTFAETTEALASSDYSGPIVSISYPSTPDDGEGVLEATAAGWLGVEPADKRHGLVDAVAAWFDAGDATVPAWSEFAGEDGAEEFGGFLMELQGTTSYSDPEFRRGVVTLLDAALAREGVRKNVFRAAVGATTSCEDRVTSACNAMQVALLVADVEEGVYDKRLADVIELARCMLRIDAIERIALETIKSDGVGDPLGFYLAHLVALRERLNLGFLAPRMFFYAASGVNAAGLDEAEKRVRQEEAAGFEDFLNGWGPWEAVARRVAPQDYAQMEEELVEAMGERFDLLLQERLVEAGVAGREDSEVKFGAEVREELAREIKGKLTRLVLEKEGLAHLLTRPD